MTNLSETDDFHKNLSTWEEFQEYFTDQLDGVQHYAGRQPGTAPQTLATIRRLAHQFPRTIVEKPNECSLNSKESETFT